MRLKLHFVVCISCFKSSFQFGGRCGTRGVCGERGNAIAAARRIQRSEEKLSSTMDPEEEAKKRSFCTQKNNFVSIKLFL